MVADTLIWAFHNPKHSKGTSDASSWMVNISQLVSLVQSLKPGANEGSIRNALSKAHEDDKRKATPSEVEKLVQERALKSGASNVQLISIPAAVAILDKKLHLDGTVITQLKEMQTGQPILPPPQSLAPTPLRQFQLQQQLARLYGPSAAAAAASGGGPRAAAACAS